MRDGRGSTTGAKNDLGRGRRLLTLLVLILSTVAMAVLTGGSFTELRRFEIRGLWLAWLAVLARLAPMLFGLDRKSHLSWAAWGTAFTVVVLIGVLNGRRIRGAYLLSLGALANVVVILANRGMPVVGWATGGDMDPLHLALIAPRLRVLSDVLVLRVGAVFSPGDVLMFVGFAVAVVSSSHRHPAPPDSSTPLVRGTASG